MKLLFITLFTLVFSISALAGSDSKRVMYAECACEVSNQDMVPINPGHQAVANPFMGLAGSTEPYFSARGSWNIQEEDCDTDSNGEPNKACGRAKFRAEMRAMGSCWDIAERYNPNLMRNEVMGLGELVPDSCLFAIEEE